MQQVTHTIFLGVTMDENLNWKHHIGQTGLKFSKITGILYRIRNNLTTEAMSSIYYTLCHPHLVYCVSIWVSTWPSFLNWLTIAHNRILWCIFFLKKFDPTNHVFSEVKVMKFSFIHKYFMLLLIFKNQRHNTIFNLTNNVLNTRNNNINLICPVFRTKLFKNSIISSESKLFNSVPVDKKVLLTTTIFDIYKKELKAYLISRSIYNFV